MKAKALTHDRSHIIESELNHSHLIVLEATEIQHHALALRLKGPIMRLINPVTMLPTQTINHSRRLQFKLRTSLSASAKAVSFSVMPKLDPEWLCSNTSSQQT